MTNNKRDALRIIGGIAFVLASFMTFNVMDKDGGKIIVVILSSCVAILFVLLQEEKSDRYRDKELLMWCIHDGKIKPKAPIEDAERIAKERIGLTPKTFAEWRETANYIHTLLHESYLSLWHK